MKFEEIKNPYTLQFSYIPPQFIERSIITNEIINNFIREVPTFREPKRRPGGALGGIGAAFSVAASCMRVSVHTLHFTPYVFTVLASM